MIQLFETAVLVRIVYRNSRRESSDLAPLIYQPTCFSNVICVVATVPPKFLAVHGFHAAKISFTRNSNRYEHDLIDDVLYDIQHIVLT